MKVGTLKRWNSDRGFGIVAVTFSEVYFLHASSVAEIPDGLKEPPIGSTIHFNISPAINGGKYPQAINARIIAPAKQTREELAAEIRQYFYVPKSREQAEPAAPVIPSPSDTKEGA